MEETIRKPIQEKLCDCNNTRIVLFDGVPTYVDVSNCSREDIDAILERPQTLRLWVNTRVYDWEYAVNRAVEKNVAVSISTNRTLSKSLLDRLHTTENNQIIYRLSSLNKVVSKVIDGSGEVEWYQVASMMSYAKAMKIHILLEVEYRPELVSMLDLFELLTALKNFSGMVHILCNPVDITRMETDITTLGGISAFNELREVILHHYSPQVKDRTWVLRSNRYESLVESLDSYLKSRKLRYRCVREVDPYRNVTDGNAKSQGIGLRNRVYVFNEEAGTEILEEPSFDRCSSCQGITLFGFSS